LLKVALNTIKQTNFSVLLTSGCRVILTDCIGSCKSNYHTITAMTAPKTLKSDYQFKSDYYTYNIRLLLQSSAYSLIAPWRPGWGKIYFMVGKISDHHDFLPEFDLCFKTVMVMKYSK
jgi:hypothetical protein